MKKTSRRLAACTVACITCASMLTGCGAVKLDGTKTVATIDGTEIPLGILSLMTRYQQGGQEQMYNYYSSMYGAAFTPNWDGESSTEEGKTNGQAFIDDVIDQMKLLYLSREKAPDYEITLSEEASSKAAEAAKAFMEANSDEAKDLLGVTEDQVKEYLELEAYSHMLNHAVSEEAPIEISDDEVNQSSFTYVSISKNGEEMTDEDKEKAKENAQAILDKMLEDPTQDMDEAAKSVDETLSASSSSFTTVKPSSEEEGLEVVEEAGTEEADGDEASEEAAADETEAAADETEAAADETEAAADETEAAADETEAAADETEAAADETEAAETEAVEESDASGFPLVLIDTLRGLSDGEMIPEVVETQNSYYVARLDLTHDEAATESTRQSLTTQQQNDYYNEVTEGWKENCDFTLDEKVLKTLVVSDERGINLVYDEPEVEETAETEESTETEETAETEESTETEEAAVTEESTETEEAAVTEESAGNKEAAKTEEKAGDKEAAKTEEKAEDKEAAKTEEKAEDQKAAEEKENSEAAEKAEAGESAEADKTSKTETSTEKSTEAAQDSKTGKSGK